MDLDKSKESDRLIWKALEAQDTVTHYNVTNQREFLRDAKLDRDWAVASLQAYVNQWIACALANSPKFQPEPTTRKEVE